MTPEQVARLPIRLPANRISAGFGIVALVAIAATTFFVDGLRYTVFSFLPFLLVMSVVYLRARRTATAGVLSSMSDVMFPAEDLRREFPALQAAGRFVFFDNAAGAQVPARVLAAVSDHLISRNVQRGGPYGRSREVDATIARSRESVADLVNAPSAQEIAFGLNATSFIRSISLAVGQTLGDRPEIVVSELDHEANVATWLALERSGARVVWWPVRSNARLYLEDLAPLVTRSTRLVACTLASNATGTRVDVAGAARIAHAAGAELFVDAVHYSPHGSIDVQALDCDYLVCSGYKVFGPHMGFAWCRTAAIDKLPTFREDFIPDAMPDKLEAGTYAYENVAGMDAAVSYLEDLGKRVGGAALARRAAVRAAMDAISAYERMLSAALLRVLADVPGTTVYGVADPDAVAARVPTVAFTIDGVSTETLATRFDDEQIGVRNGHMYAPRLMRRLGATDGVVRASLVHYNTVAEIERFRESLRPHPHRPHQAGVVTPFVHSRGCRHAVARPVPRPVSDSAPPRLRQQLFAGRTVDRCRGRVRRLHGVVARARLTVGDVGGGRRRPARQVRAVDRRLA